MKQTIKITNLLAVIISVLICIGISALPARAQLITVTNTNDSGAGSLRQAITNANANGFLDLIRFQIPTSDPNFANGVFTFRLTSALPPLTDNVTAIDGATQTLFTGDTNPFGPEIVLNGSLAGSSDGLNITSSSCTINSLVINGWGNSAVYIHTGSANTNRVIGSYIGTNASGNTSVPNGTASSFAGITISGSSNNLIGGTSPIERNVISGNQGWGVAIENGASNNTISGNYIGLNAAGNAALGNGADGVEMGSATASGNIVGGTANGAGNVISGNRAAGIAFNGASGNFVRGNFIGTDATDSVLIPNAFPGVVINYGAQGNIIGGTAASAGNFIATNGQDGVRVAGTGAGNAVIGNSIFGDGGLGINLAGGNENSYGVTANDTGDADAGANNLQNYPVLTAATAGSSLNLSVTLNSIPNSQYLVEFFSSPSCNASGYGEGIFNLGRTALPNEAGTLVATDANGNTGFNFSVPRPTNNSLFVTATATRLNGQNLTDTSEFSQCRKITGRAGREGDFDGDGKTDIGVFRRRQMVSGIRLIRQTDNFAGRRSDKTETFRCPPITTRTAKPISPCGDRQTALGIFCSTADSLSVSSSDNPATFLSSKI